MPKGIKSVIGTEKIINGYLYVKVADGHWQLKHRIIMEEMLGRPLTKAEYIRFKDGNRKNLDPDNLELHLTNKSSLLKRIKEVKKKIADLQQELADLEGLI